MNVKITILPRLTLTKLALSLIFLTLPCAGQSLPPVANAGVIYECENSFCGAWTWDNGHYVGRWDNGAIATLTVQSFTAQSVILNRTDTSLSVSSGLTAIYMGKISGQGNSIVDGSVTYTWPGHGSFPQTLTWGGIWGAPQEFTISTVAGSGTVGYSGDGGAAISANLNSPLAIALDPAGNLYIADQQNNRVRKVTPNGTITTIAGTGVAGFSGDGGLAISAKLNIPTNVFVDTTGNIFIADQFNNRVRKIDTNGIITTFAGSNTQGYCGDGAAATSACLNGPLDVVADASGNVYICEVGNGRIRKVTNGIITTVAGNGGGNETGDGGPATSASVPGPQSIALNAAGEIFIAEYTRIRKVSNGIITTVAGTGAAGYSGDGGQATSALLNYPRGTRVDSSGNLYFSDFNNNVVRVLLTNGTVFTIAGNFSAAYSGDGGPATIAGINTYGVAIASSGAIYVSDRGNARIRLLTPMTQNPTIIANSGVINGASLQSGIVPDSWITIQGTNLSTLTDTWTNAIVNGNLPTSLDGVSVSVGGQPAFIYYVSPSQINAIAPNVPPGPLQVTVTSGGVTSAAVTATSQSVQPAFFQWGTYAVATNTSYGLAVKNGTFPTVTTTPAQPGQVIVLWGTGFGPTSPAAPIGVQVPSTGQTYNTAAPVTVTVGGVNATVYGTALTPGLAALYQVAVQIPASLANGDYPVIATINGVSSPSTTLITVQQ